MRFLKCEFLDRLSIFAQCEAYCDLNSRKIPGLIDLDTKVFQIYASYQIRKSDRCLFSGQEHVFNCLKNLGFSDECSKIWQYNIKHTKEVCFGVCIWSWITNEPFNKPDGSLNDCIQCDEDKSGPNFKYFSGRTRRNSGIPSAIHRPPETIYNMTHCYWYGELEY